MFWKKISKYGTKNMLVLGHYLFLKFHSFPWALLLQNSSFQIQRWFFTKYRLMPTGTTFPWVHAPRTRLNYYNCKIDYPVCTTKLIKQCLPWDIPSSCFQMLVEKHVHPHTIPEVLLQKSEILVERTGAVLYTGVFH